MCFDCIFVPVHDMLAKNDSIVLEFGTPACFPAACGFMQQMLSCRLIPFDALIDLAPVLLFWSDLQFDLSFSGG